MISAWLAFTLAAKLKGKEEKITLGRRKMDVFLVLLVGAKKLGEALFRANDAAYAWPEVQDCVSLPGISKRSRKGLFLGDGKEVG